MTRGVDAERCWYRVQWYLYPDSVATFQWESCTLEYRVVGDH
ncbi:hypothetical protein O9993_16665 [Vibrio lentus]|nr:hypothetical protein [Vibrio lentus]